MSEQERRSHELVEMYQRGWSAGLTLVRQRYGQDVGDEVRSLMAQALRDAITVVERHPRPGE